MFRRRRKRGALQWARQLVWPDMGFRRALRYFGHRLGRLPGTPYSIAAGFAFGAAISFTPLFGLHIALAALMAWICRANILAAAIGTAVGNPWTFPMIWIVVYRTGVWALGVESGAPPPDDLTWRSVLEQFWGLFVPMMVGGVPLGALVWLAFFWPGRYLVAGYQRARRQRLGRHRLAHLRGLRRTTKGIDR